MSDALLLTKADALNYRAVCAIAEGRLVRRTRQRREADRLSPAQKLTMLQRQDYACAECGCEFVVHEGKCPEATAEHIIPFRFGGENNRYNIMLVCQPCNVERDRGFSIEAVEKHFGPIDRSMLDYVPVVQFRQERTR